MGIVTDSVTPLQIGDTIPEYLWHLPLQVVNHPQGKETITLDEYRGKLVILDFWATWCTACIKDLPEKLELSNSLEHPSVLLLIASEPAAKIATSLAKQHASSKFNVTSVVNDVIVKRHFPHRFVPHYVIIRPDGRIAAYLASQHVTEENLTVAANGAELNVPMKTDIRADGTRPLADLLNLSQTSKQRYTATITDSIDGIGYASGNKFIDNGRRFYFYNRSVIRILEFALETRITDRTAGDLRTLPDSAINTPICYELFVPKDTPIIEIRKAMLQDMGRLLRAKLALVDGAVSVTRD